MKALVVTVSVGLLAVPIIAEAAVELTVLTYNVQMNGFVGSDPSGAYPDKGSFDSWRAESVALETTIRTANADVVALQEVNDNFVVAAGSIGAGALPGAGPTLSRFEQLAARLSDLYPYASFVPSREQRWPAGNAILSRFPMTVQDTVCLFRGSKNKPGYGDKTYPGCTRRLSNGGEAGSGNRIGQFVHLEIGGTTVGFIATHLGVYETSCGRHMNHENAGCSALALNEALRNTTLPVILAGDFNVHCDTSDMNASSEARGFGVNNIMNLSVRWDFFETISNAEVAALCSTPLHTQIDPTSCGQHQIDYVVGSTSTHPSFGVPTPDWEILARSRVTDVPHASDHYGILTQLRLLVPNPVRAWASNAALLDECTAAELTELAESLAP